MEEKKYFYDLLKGNHIAYSDSKDQTYIHFKNSITTEEYNSEETYEKRDVYSELYSSVS